MVNGKYADLIACNVSVLIVEDDQITAKVAKAICESLGCTAHIARNGMEALQCYDEHRLDLVLLDLQMPVMGGFETAFELRHLEQERGNTPLPIIAVTGTMEQDNHIRSLAAGMNDCVNKPYTVQMVRGLLERYVQGYHGPDTLPGEDKPDRTAGCNLG